MADDSPTLQGNRDTGEVIFDLEQLCQEEGFIYTFAFVAFSALMSSQEEMEEIDWSQRPNHRELSFVLGLMVKRQISLNFPQDKEILYSQYDRVHVLLKELHRAQTGTDFDNGQGMVEPIFYGGEGANHLQFLAMAEKRYRKDNQWIEDYTGMDILTLIEVTNQLEKLINDRFTHMETPISLREFAQQCLENFLFGPEDIPDVPQETATRFLDTFSIIEEANEELDSLGGYNEVHSRPIILLENGQYFLPIVPYLARSIYDSPYYWMTEDAQYKATALRNRGDATEEIAYTLLKGIFDRNLFRSVKIRKQGQDITDIDVLAIYGNKAIVVQAKSKKLTIPSREGDNASLRSDFRQAVQAAYDQACLSRKALLGMECEFYDNEGTRVMFAETIDEAYIVCITGDHYPAVTVQVYKYLEKNTEELPPLAMSLFDLEIVTHYLNDPLDFLYYVKQRNNYSEEIRASSEIALLGFHLDFKLTPDSKRNFFIGEDFAQNVYTAYMGFEYGGDMEDLLELKCAWKTPQFTQILECIKNSSLTNKTDAMLCFYDVAGMRTEDLFSSLQTLEQMTHSDGSPHDRSALLPSTGNGVTLITYPYPDNQIRRDYVLNHFQMFSNARKYKSFAREWIVLGSVVGTPEIVDLVWYSNDPWQSDPRLNDMAQALLRPRKTKDSRGQRIRNTPHRNQPCPCGSRLKFKKCHGRRI